MSVARLRRDARGATLIEAALVLPVAMTLIMGVLELGYEQYVRSALDGVAEQAGRNSALQNADFNAIDTAARTQIQRVVPNATVTFSRKSYATFSNIKPEPFIDLNNNNKRDPGECFTDLNGNGTWDLDPGVSGQGGADDVTVYVVTATYDQIFPLAGFLGGSSTVTQSSQTTLKNQPYAKQAVTAAKTICT